MKKEKLIQLLTLAAIFVPVVFLLAHPALAQTRQDFLRLRLPLYWAQSPDDFFSLLGTIINFVLLIGGIVTFFFFIYGGFIYLTSGGDPGKASTGQKIIVNAIIGIVIIFLSYSLVSFIVRRIDEGGGQTNGTF